MMRQANIKPFLLPLFCLLWISCSQDDKLPKDILPVNKMSQIMLDLQIARAYNYSYFPETDSLSYPDDREQRLKIFYRQIFLLHHTDTAQFFKSFRFYSSHPDWLKKAYSQMQDSLKQKQNWQQAIEEKRRTEEEKSLQADNNSLSQWQKTFKTWHAFSDSIHQQCSQTTYPWEHWLPE